MRRLKTQHAGIDFFPGGGMIPLFSIFPDLNSPIRLHKPRSQLDRKEKINMHLFIIKQMPPGTVRLRRLYRPYSPIAGTLVLFILLFATGCTPKKQTETFDRNSQLLTIETLRAIGEQDYTLAERKLQRLAREYPAADEIPLLLQDIRDRRAIQNANKQIKQQKLSAALHILEADSRQYNAGNEVIRRQNSLRALLDLQHYLEHGAFIDAKAMQTALASLPSPLAFGSGTARYAAWLNAQHAQARHFAKLERERLAQELVYAIDAAMLRNRKEATFLLARLGALMPTHPYWLTWKSVLQGTAPPKSVRTFAPAEDLRCFLLSPHRAATVQASSLLGLAATAQSAFAAGDWRRGIAHYQTLRRLIPAPLAPELGTSLWGGLSDRQRHNINPSTASILRLLFAGVQSGTHL